METASPQPVGVLLSTGPAVVREAAQEQAGLRADGLPDALKMPLLQQLWERADAQSCDLTPEEFREVLLQVGRRCNFGLHAGKLPDEAQQAAFLHALHLPELALAQACALGREAAWGRFLALYREPLTRAAISITGSATLGHELAGSLYAELYGLKERDGERSSPLRSYTGRGSLLGWLRSTLAQRSVDHHRRTYREDPLEALEPPAPEHPPQPRPAQLQQLTNSVSRTLLALAPEDRFLLSSYFLDGRTLLQIAPLLNVHEATVSRRLKRLTSELRKELLRSLESGGLSRRGAEEALGADPRDLEINLKTILQTSQSPPFPVQTKPASYPKEKSNPFGGSR